MKKTMYLVTHNSVFHADEVMATAILFNVFCDNHLELIRTNNPSDYFNNDDAIIYDIGLGKYDHHQKGGNGTRENGVPYAACGLIWKDFGLICIKNVISNMKLDIDEDDIQLIADIIDKSIIQGIDANDNGYHPDEIPTISNFNISNIVSSFNNITYYGGVSHLRQNNNFRDAVDICREILNANIERLADSISLQNELMDIIEDRDDEHILVLERYIPWTKYVVENTTDDEIWFVVYPSSRNEGEWNMQAIPISTDSFEQRHSVPESWWGGNKETLPKITGISGARFCHQSNGFLTTAASFEDIMNLAKIACQ